MENTRSYELNISQQERIRADMKDAIDVIIAADLPNYIQLIKDCAKPPGQNDEDFSDTAFNVWDEFAVKSNDIPEDYRGVWQQFIDQLKHNQPISSQIKDVLVESLNFDPNKFRGIQLFQNLREMQLFHQHLDGGLDLEVMKALTLIREAYLEVAPQVRPAYGINYSPYGQRQISIPFELDKHGDSPASGIIRDMVVNCLEDRLKEDIDQAQGPGQFNTPFAKSIGQLVHAIADAIRPNIKDYDPNAPRSFAAAHDR